MGAPVRGGPQYSKPPGSGQAFGAPVGPAYEAPGTGWEAMFCLDHGSADVTMGHGTRLELSAVYEVLTKTR